ncbi:MAG: hypothetical protein ACLGHT_02635, partial [Acidimicrobiia bacterium]
MFPSPVARAVEEIAEELAVVVEGFDPRTTTATAAGQVLAAADRVEKMASCLKSLAAARVADADAQRRRSSAEGRAPSAADRLANRTGTSRGAAKRSIDTGRRLEDQPELDAAS